MPLELGQPPRMAVFNVTSAGLATVMGTRLIRGTWFTDAESTPVIAINESFARQEFDGADPIGRRVHMPGARLLPEAWRLATITAVVADVKYSKLDENPEPEMYVPYYFAPDLSRLTVLAKTAGDPLKAAATIQKVFSETDKAQPAFDVMTMEQAMANSIAPRRLNLFLLGAFAASALLLAVIGIYGVVSLSVAARTHEIGVRMALGAGRGAVIRMVLWEGFNWAFGGIVCGLVMASWLTRSIESLLYDVKPNDPMTLTVVVIALTTATLGACLLPALKASRMEPVLALRNE